MRVILIVAALFGVWFVWNRLRLPGSLLWNAARRARKEQERVAALPTAKLVEEVRSRIRFERWERFGAAIRILDDDGWTDASLLQGLNDLYAEAVNEQPGNYGRGSNIFEFYDCGLAHIVESLKKRTASTR